MISKTDYFELKTGTPIIVIERIDTIDGELLKLPFSKVVAADDPNISESLADGKIHYLFDFEIGE
ncbi:UNVERIFIED_ORG: hypothetical protein GCAPEGMB_00079 [Vibrio phage V07]|uniref:Uncharacterized protein n=1 Tax=Vibrio phage phi-pp2 TaxID=1204514 RepID=I6XBS5_9CAUD|nr:hypothetical protein pp2_032 [Vibrio phage phi-pp2]WOL24943.1 hypothetical protein [Vibrio phage PG216]